MIKFKNKNSKTAGTPRTEADKTVYQLSANFIPIKSFNKYIIRKVTTPKKALDKINFKSFRSRAAKIKIIRKHKIIMPRIKYFKNSIKSPFNIMKF